MLLYLIGVLLKWNCWNQFMEPLHCLGCTSPDHFILYLSILAPHIPLKWLPLKDYKDLTEIPAKNFLTTDQVAYFVTKDIYEKLEPNEWLLQFLEESIKAFSSEIEKLIAIALPKFASSFNTQKGAIFGFGPSAELEPTGNVLKLCNTDSNTLDKLDTHVQIHNLAQEWNVGCINYSLAISGKENLTTVSQRNVIKTAGDLITDCKPDNYKKLNSK